MSLGQSRVSEESDASKERQAGDETCGDGPSHGLQTTKAEGVFACAHQERCRCSRGCRVRDLDHEFLSPFLCWCKLLRGEVTDGA